LLHQIASHPHGYTQKKAGGGSRELGKGKRKSWQKSHSPQSNLTCTLRYVTDVVVWAADSSFGMGFDWVSARVRWVLNDCSLTDCLTDTDVDEYQVNPFVTSGKKASRWASSGVTPLSPFSTFTALGSEASTRRRIRGS